MIKEEIKKEIIKVLKELGLPADNFNLEHPADLTNGDYATNYCLVKNKKLGKKESKNLFSSPLVMAQKIKEKWQELGLPDYLEKIEVAPPGFINFWLKTNFLDDQLREIIKEKNQYGAVREMRGRKIMVEYAHPNTHKELHVGHMRTLITGEAIARIFAVAGASVFRANYQGDIGPHVAKSIWGTEKILKERNTSWEEAEKMTLPEKAHLLGEGYVLGVQEYEDSLVAKEIDELNSKLYKKEAAVLPSYERTRRWSLDYYNTFYSRFYTKFDRLFFESEVAGPGKEIVLKNLGRVFEKSQGAVIFDGEKYGLHKRVFITADGNTTYEGKDMALAYKQYQAFPFDLNVHVVANEQSGYFQVIIKALEILDPQFTGKQYHLPMGMVQLVGKKMSSRTGVILRVDDLLEEVKKLIMPLISKEDLSDKEKEEISEVLTIASVKYSILRVNPRQDVLFDPEKSVSLEGDSGPYLEYTHTRALSVLRKAKKTVSFQSSEPVKPNNEEMALLRTIYRFPEIVREASLQFSPSLICGFLFDLAQKFNLFYDRNRIIGQPQEGFRLQLTASVAQVIRNGLDLLGIKTLERM